MATLDRQCDYHARFGTHSHGDETLVARGGEYPSQLKWSDLHPPGVTVLPKGSPPAGPEEINWEDTLGGKFALALKRLEGLLYAVWGSIPASYPEGKVQWYDRVHPRCRWGPEIWEPRCLLGPTGCGTTGCNGNCYDYQETGKEYAALGEQPPCCAMPRPSVPIRSRSGDPEAQYRRAAHGAVFPVGSVSRSHSAAPHDPEGSGWFGATQPGRLQGTDTWLTAGNGYTQKAGHAVTITYTPPGGAQVPDLMTLYYRVKPPGGAWGAWTSTTMIFGGGAYTATTGAQRHGAEVQWYLEWWWDDAGTEHYVYEPGGGTDPASPPTGAPYSYVAFTHFNPYAHGLPELLDNYGGVNVRHGTDGYQFDGGETLQPELLNLARFVLSWLAGSTCRNADEGCANRGSVLYHSPHLRSASHGECCAPLSIQFYWSGSNAHPHFRRRGKGDQASWSPLDTRPLHWPHDPAGLEAARKGWRGIGNLFRDDPHNNPYYGGGASWNTPPAELRLWYEPDHSPDAQVYAKFEHVGLRPGDVIDPVHIQEIIDAVEYLVSYGVWTHEDTCTRKRTPTAHMGVPCGALIEEQEDSFGLALTCTTTVPCQKCCASCDPSAYTYVCSDGTNEVVGDQTCTPHPTPTYADCWSDCQQQKCGLKSNRAADCSWTPSNWNTLHTRQANCDSGCACGSASRSRVCDWVEPVSLAERLSAAEVCGWSAFVCTPPAVRPDGFDSTHGNRFLKERYDHTWHPELWAVATGQRSGNGYGDIVICGADDAGLPIEAGFGQVHAVRFDGSAAGWWAWAASCSASSECWDGWDDPAPPIPGLGLHDASGTPLCGFTWHTAAGGGGFLQDGQGCTCPDQPCIDGCWVAVNLNLDGTDVPYSNASPGYQGDRVPRLRPYSLLEDPGVKQHGCPCETWTGAAVCT